MTPGPEKSKDGWMTGTCPKCGTVNRWPPQDVYRCGNCKTVVPRVRQEGP